MDRLPDGLRALAPAVAAAVGFVLLSLAIVVFIGSEGFGYDYIAYDDAARRIADGRPLYLADTVDRYARGAYDGLFLYPPPMAIALVPLTVLSQTGATTVWLALRVALLAVGCAIMPVARPTRLFTFAAAALSFPVLFDLNIGNVSVLAFALLALAWRTQGTVVAAIAHAALVAIRIPFGAFAVQWLAQRRPRTLAWTIVAGSGLILLSLPIVGLATYLDYVTILRGLPDLSTGPHNLSLRSTLASVGLPDAIASLGLPLGYASGIVAIAFGARRRDTDVAFVITAMATLLVAPFIHPHYLVLLLLPAALLMDRGHGWAFALPLLGWLPGQLLPLIAPATIAVILLVTADGRAAGRDRVPYDEPEPFSS